MFEKCCNSPSINEYAIIHDPKPIILSCSMDEIIKRLLWYVPQIESFQAAKNELIEDKVYDDFTFTYILNHMGMVEERDVKWLDGKDTVDDNEWNYYENKICCNCQKLILTRYKNQSKTHNFLRCVRNSIAHGRFAVVGDYIIGFSTQPKKDVPGGLKKAVIKIKPRMLLSALDALSSQRAKESLLSYAFERIGYNIIQAKDNDFFDLRIEKDGKQYVIEIKEFRGSPYLHSNDLNGFLEKSEHLLPGTERVLYIDTSHVTRDVRKKEEGIDGLRIIDIGQVKKLLQEAPVDILDLSNVLRKG